MDQLTYNIDMIAAKYRFLQDDTMLEKVQRLDRSIEEIHDQFTELKDLIIDEVDKQSGEVAETIIKETKGKIFITSQVFSEVQVMQRQDVFSYRDIVETLREQRVILHYQTPLPPS
ncbi:hypothetical protein [Amphibacillus cookii]|uniref:hypothetical protein n=1 Tax=Amphibacillus cookii TaxID=767787 RepID=UPI00195D0D46|nr:hypothetical protein [Amphibacillus cookii]MBM7540251.1 vacuolar-type H+-ATPase subunit H [Amphibacillus cookii]